VINVDGSGLTRLTTDTARDGLPTWSPNGQVIAFASNRDGGWSIRAINANGSFQQKLFDMVNSPDGIVFYDQANSSGWLEERISWTR
jgi:Tol biopolymer transport system component